MKMSLKFLAFFLLAVSIIPIASAKKPPSKEEVKKRKAAAVKCRDAVTSVLAEYCKKHVCKCDGTKKIKTSRNCSFPEYNKKIRAYLKNKIENNKAAVTNGLCKVIVSSVRMWIRAKEPGIDEGSVRGIVRVINKAGAASKGVCISTMIAKANPKSNFHYADVRTYWKSCK